MHSLFTKVQNYFSNKISLMKNNISSYFSEKKYIKTLNKLFRSLIIILVCLVVTIVIIFAASKEPFSALEAFFIGPFSDLDSIVSILDEAIPLIFTGIAVCIMNRAGQCNMFVEGAFFMGAFISAYLAPELSILPSFLIPIICLLLSFVLSGIVGYIPAVMKGRLKINEFVSSLMLNYIVFWIIMFLLDGPCSDPDVANKTKYLEDFMKLFVLDTNTGFSIAFIIAIISAILAFIFLYKTIFGYRLRMTGDNEDFARYIGINSTRYVISSQVIGAGIAGFGGGVLMLGGARFFRFEWKTLPNYGFDGFVIAIIANNNPLLTPLAALFIAYLRVGAIKMSVMNDVPNQVIYIIQALIIIFFGSKMVFKLIKDNKRKNKVIDKEVK